MTTLSLEASKKVYEIVGEYETEECHDADDGWTNEVTGKHEYIPRPNFAELVRVLPKIIRAKRPEWRVNDSIGMYAEKYALAPTEPEGMAAVETYLMKLL